MENDEKGYNGWTNYETWAVKLWLDNEETSYRYWLECARHFRESDGDDKDKSAYRLAKMLKEQIEEGSPLSSGMYADLLGAALSMVDWREIAFAMLED